MMPMNITSVFSILSETAVSPRANMAALEANEAAAI